MKTIEVNYSSSRTSAVASTTATSYENYSDVNYSFIDQLTDTLYNKVQALREDAMRLHSLVVKCKGNSPSDSDELNKSQINVTHEQKLEALLAFFESTHSIIWNNINTLETFI